MISKRAFPFVTLLLYLFQTYQVGCYLQPVTVIGWKAEDVKSTLMSSIWTLDEQQMNAVKEDLNHFTLKLQPRAKPLFQLTVWIFLREPRYRCHFPGSLWCASGSEGKCFWQAGVQASNFKVIKFSGVSRFCVQRENFSAPQTLLRCWLSVTDSRWG